MNLVAMPFLFLLMILVVLVGMIGIAVIYLISRRYRRSIKQHSANRYDQKDEIDPWAEAGKRMNGDIHEPE